MKVWLLLEFFFFKVILGYNCLVSLWHKTFHWINHVCFLEMDRYLVANRLTQWFQPSLSGLLQKMQRALAFPQGDVTDQFSQRFTEQSLAVRQALIFSDEAPSCVWNIFTALPLQRHSTQRQTGFSPGPKRKARVEDQNLISGAQTGLTKRFRADKTLLFNWNFYFTIHVRIERWQRPTWDLLCVI